MRGFRLFEARRSRSLRKDATSAERKLWARLRNRQLDGHKFVRQELVGPYFADFVCREHSPVVEVDGATHSTDEELARDAARTAFLSARGYRVFRFANADVFGNLNGVLETILDVLKAQSDASANSPGPSPQPSPRKRGEGVRLAP